jgi:transposase
MQDRSRSGRPRKVTRVWERLLVRTVEQDPHRVGVLRAAWTAPALTEYLAEKTGIRVSAELVRHYLRIHGHAPPRPTRATQRKIPALGTDGNGTFLRRSRRSLTLGDHR